MKKVLICVIALAAMSVGATQASAESDALKAWKECAAKVRKDYPVPPGNVNELNMMIREECGDRPSS